MHIVDVEKVSYEELLLSTGDRYRRYGPTNWEFIPVSCTSYCISAEGLANKVVVLNIDDCRSMESKYRKYKSRNKHVKKSLGGQD